MKKRKEVEVKAAVSYIKSFLEKRFPDIGFDDGISWEKDSASFFFALILKPEGEKYTWEDLSSGLVEDLVQKRREND